MDKASPNVSSADYAYTSLRSKILTGALAPGSRLNQVHIARDLSISRGPLREALSRLQQEGLIEMSANQQARVAQLTVTDLEQIYAGRIVLEALCLRISLPRLGAVELTELTRLMAAMDLSAQSGDRESWDKAHLDFHRLLLSKSGDRLVRETDRLREHAERYRLVYANYPHAHLQAGRDHAELLQACVDGPIDIAVEKLAHHQARTALTVAAMLDPVHEPRTVREAVRVVTAQQPNAPAPAKRQTARTQRRPGGIRTAQP